MKIEFTSTYKAMRAKIAILKKDVSTLAEMDLPLELAKYNNVEFIEYHITEKTRSDGNINRHSHKDCLILS